MNRQVIISACVGAIYGWAVTECFLEGRFVCGALLLVAWLLGMANNMTPQKRN